MRKPLQFQLQQIVDSLAYNISPIVDELVGLMNEIGTMEIKRGTSSTVLQFVIDGEMYDDENGVRNEWHCRILIRYFMGRH